MTSAPLAFSCFQQCRPKRSVRHHSFFIRNEDRLGLRVVSDPALSFDLSSSSIGDPTVSAQVFEPVLNLPAFSSFFFITIVYTLLNLRARKIQEAAVARQEALERLRDLKSKELDGKLDSHEQVEQALLQYEQCSQEEEDLRTIIPGIARIRRPPRPPGVEDNEAAARQFLNTTKSVAFPEEDEVVGSTLTPMLGVASLVILLVIPMALFIAMNTMDPMGPQPPALSM